MQQLEFEGRSTEEAIENALRELNISRDEMEIEVIEPGSPGIFGLVGGKKARVKVMVAGDIADVADDAKGLSVAKETLENILALIPMEGTTVTAEQRDGTIALNIEGDKSGLLIGRKGRTLDALQFIVNKVVNKALTKRGRVVVDSENYRQRRRDSLIQMH